MLEQEEYYNLIRTPPDQVEQNYTANALLLMLEEEGFIFRCIVEIEEDLDGRVIRRRLIHIFFSHPN